MNIQIETIDTGYFYADGGAMFGAIPKTAWNRKYPSDEMNGCVLAMRSLLVQTADRCLLIDTGAGYKHLKSLSYYRFFGLKDLKEELCLRNLSPEDITDVVLTHLHFDHCGYCTWEEGDELRLTFPNATHWVSERQWHAFRRPHPLEKDSFFLEDMDLVEKSGKLCLITGPQVLCPNVTLLLADGHTYGQIVPCIQGNEEPILFAGDVIPLLASVSPEWISAYDVYPIASYDEKIRLLEQAVQGDYRIVFCHDAYTISSKIKKTSGGLYLPDRESIQKR